MEAGNGKDGTCQLAQKPFRFWLQGIEECLQTDELEEVQRNEVEDYLHLHIASGL